MAERPGQHYRRINNIDDMLGTAVNVQAMVYGNLGEDLHDELANKLEIYFVKSQEVEIQNTQDTKKISHF